jgi:hypothetical protein
VHASAPACSYMLAPRFVSPPLPMMVEASAIGTLHGEQWCKHVCHPCTTRAHTLAHPRMQAVHVRL